MKQPADQLDGTNLPCRKQKKRKDENARPHLPFRPRYSTMSPPSINQHHASPHNHHTSAKKMSMTKVSPIQTIATGDKDDPNNKQHADSFHKIEIDLQDTMQIEDSLHELRLRRLQELRQLIYILPMAKANLQAQDDDLFSLEEKVQEFLASQRQVMLVLGDSGVGKSTFNRHLEHQLWTDYEHGGPIPLYINLPTIDDPAHNLIEKQLQYLDFSDDQIQKMKHHRQFILVCDGYDESQLTINIHTTNHLNQPGQWRSKIVISCRSQYLGQEYRSQFQPQSVDQDQSTWSNLYQEAVIAPFSKEQIEEYVTHYVPLEPRPWVTRDYMHMLTTIPNLMDLVKNPFLLTLALEALPSIAEGQQDISTVRVTRVQLYDRFVDHWLSINKRRLESNALSVDDRMIFDQLLDAGFISMGIDYAMRLALAVFERQDGNPIVRYNHLRDHNTWKAEFFGADPVVRLLQESCPLTRTGNQFLFLHRSMLEYFFSLVVYNPVRTDDDFKTQTETPSFTAHAFDPSNPLFLRNLLTEPSIIQFLCDRVKLDSTFNQQLLSVVNLSKTDAAITTTTAATNAITILVRAGFCFNGADLQGIKVPGADLSGGQFDYAQLQGADLTGVNLSRSWLRKADLSGAQMGGIQFGEFPYLELNGSVQACAYSSDGSMVAVGVANQGTRVSIYDTSSWTGIYSFRMTEEVQSMAFSPDGTRVWAGANDGYMRLWDCARGRKILNVKGHNTHYYISERDYVNDQEILIMHGHGHSVNSVTFSPCGRHIASCSNDKTVQVWDSQTGKCLLVFKNHTDKVRSVKYSPDGERLVSGGDDGTIRYWDLKTGKPGVVWDCSLGKVYSLAFSPDGRWIASGHAGGGLQLWHAVSAEPGPVLHGHTGQVTGIAFSPDSQWIASSSSDSTVRLWNASTGTLINMLSSHKKWVSDVVFSPNGLQIASGGSDDKVRLWDVESILKSSVEQQDQLGVVGKTVYSPNGQHIVTVGNNHTIKQWSSLAGVSIPPSIELPESLSVKSVSYSLNGSPTVVATQDRTIQLWVPQAKSPETILEGSSTVEYVTMSPCNRWIVSVGWYNTVTLWDLASTQQMHVLIEEGGPTGDIIRCMAFSTTGPQLAVGSWMGHIWLFNPQSKELLTFTSTLWSIEAMSFSPDGQQLAVGDGNGWINLRGLQPDDRDIELTLHRDHVTCIAYSPCGEWIASGSGDQTVELWRRRQPPGDTESWSYVSTVRGFFDMVLDIAWSPTVPMEFVTGCADESVRVWRVSSDGEDVAIKLLWGTNLSVLHANGLALKGTIGLSPMHRKLLVQRGAVYIPSTLMRMDSEV